MSQSTTHVHVHRDWPYSSSSIARTHHSIIANAKDTLRNGEPVSWFTCVFILEISSIYYIPQEKGMKGASVLVAHKHSNLCTGAVIALCVPWGNCQGPHGCLVG